MESPNTGEEKAGLDRRTVIRRGAILGGALVWTAPAVQTIAGPAFATGSPQCTATLSGTFDPDGPGGPLPKQCGTFTYKTTPACCDCIATYVGMGLPTPAAVGLCGFFGTCAVDTIEAC